MSNESSDDSPLLMALEALNALDTIVYVGAGAGTDLPWLLNSKAQKIIVVEPNSNLVSALKRIGGNDARLEVLPFALAETTGQSTLYMLNFSSLSGLKPPTDALRSLFPGLRIISEQPVETLNVSDLISRISLPAAGDNMMILDAPGEELAILRQIVGLQAPVFKTIILRATSEILYENGSSTQELQPILEAGGYLTESLLRDDAGFTELWFRFDAHAATVAQMKAALTQMRAAADELQQRLENAEDRLLQADEALRAETTRSQAAQARLLDLEVTLSDMSKSYSEKSAAADELQQRLENAEDRLLQADEALRAETTRSQAAQARLTELDAALLLRASEAEYLQQAYDKIEVENQKNKDMLCDKTEQARLAEARLTELEEALAQAKSASEQLQHALTDAQGQILQKDQALQAETMKIKELEHKQWLASTEFSRFEGQVDILKDLLLRDESL
ncbi:hypothetical protein [Asticcacaulis sp. EMRT-3]|uniref:hypothetical protein n=1 Tax=Asticcacaulis sp. EMRT-3 TaxID=3040349 RepID=UPI0024AEBE95|nr:hypothetical protein [Asticcacaulis sp. EMRT-3]MDI7776466.1 hypothetical protein [Asticcacaulis sp. EMRT-3]